jgi:hypothetical protein
MDNLGSPIRSSSKWPFRPNLSAGGMRRAAHRVAAWGPVVETYAGVPEIEPSGSSAISPRSR